MFCYDNQQLPSTCFNWGYLQGWDPLPFMFLFKGFLDEAKLWCLIFYG